MLQLFKALVAISYD